MAHLILDYSANLSPEELRLDELLEKLTAAAAESGVFPLAGLRARAIRCEHFRVADGHPDNAFVNLSTKVGRGRDVDTRKRAGQQLFDVLTEHLQPVSDARALAISFEMRELDADVKFNQNNLREKMAERQSESARPDRG